MSEDTKEPDTFTCDNCGKTFEKEWSDEEAALEMNREFGDYRGEVATVCDDCYKKMGFGDE